MNTIKTKQWLARYSSIISLILNFVFAIIVICASKIIYETNDDWYLSLIAQGFFGEGTSQYLYFSNIILGYILNILYFIYYSINWYICFQLILISLSAYAIWMIIKDIKGIYLATIANMLLWIVVFFDCLTSIQFTKTAGIISLIGLISVYYGNKFKDKILIVIGFVLSIFGFMYRVDSFLLVIPCAVSLMIFDLYTTAKKNKAMFKEHIKKFLVLFGLIFILFIINKFSYNNKEWKDFERYNNARVTIIDYSYAPHWENPDLYEKINYSRNDYDILSTWLGDDVNNFKIEDLEYIINNKDYDLLSKISINGFFQFAKEYILETNIVSIVILFVLSILTLFNKKTIIYFIITFLMEFGLLFFFFTLGRCPERIRSIIRAFRYVSLIIILISTNKMDLSKYRKYGLLGLAFLLLATSLYQRRDNSFKDTLFSEIIKTRNNTFILDVSGNNIDLYKQESPLFSYGKDYLENCDLLYSWPSRSPIAANRRKEKSYDQSPYVQLLNDNNTYLVVKNEMQTYLIEQYFKEHYNQEIERKYVDSIYIGEDTYYIFDYVKK